MESVPDLIRGVQAGDAAAEQMLWSEFFERLLRYLEVRARRRGVPIGLLDEEAITASALESVFKCAKEGRLENVQNWEELSRLLFAITNRKFVDHWRRATAQKAYPSAPLLELPADGALISAEEIATGFEEQLSQLMNLLPDELHRQIAVLKLAGYTLAEIAEHIGRSIPTVNRKWRNIREIWADELEKREWLD